jgi:dienelactone hydrolase
VRITLDHLTLDGVLALPPDAQGLVLFAHGSGSSRFSSRNRFVARHLNQAGIATLLFDLLTAEEEAREAVTRHLRFNIDLLSERLVAATDYVSSLPDTVGLPLGYFGASTGAAAALTAAAARPALIRAVVSRGGRPDLAAPRIAGVRAPTLLIVGGADHEVLALNQSVLPLLPAASELAVVPHATHLFEEPGTLEQVARLATAWFDRWLT